jgi:hypothetical protein
MIGLICNLLIVFVLGRDKSMNGTTRFLLQQLALVDVVYYNVLHPVRAAICKYDRLFNYHYALHRFYYVPSCRRYLVKLFIVDLPMVSQTTTAWMGSSCNLLSIHGRQQTARCASF